MDYSNIPTYLEYPKHDTSDPEWLNYVKQWENYVEQHLYRKLNKKEYDNLWSYHAEINMNECILLLHHNCVNLGLHVPILSGLYGDCMFESLNYHGIGKDVKSLREGLSFIMYTFKDYKLIPSIDLTLSEMFIPYNEVKYVIGKNKFDQKKFYTYTYDIMCQDLSNSCSWSKLPTQLLLTIISFLYKVKIVIINDNEGSWNPTINAYESIENSPTLKTIYIGHIGESHYVPIDYKPINEPHQIKKYKDSKQKFKKWAKEIERKVYQNYQSNLMENQYNIESEEYDYIDFNSELNEVNFD